MLQLAQIMDVKPAPPEISRSPVMDVVPPPAEPEPAPAETPAEKPAPKPPAPPKPASPKQTNGNVIAAIFATVIIVLGLSAMAVMAYIKTK
jgi:hypothetical protein